MQFQDSAVLLSLLARLAEAQTMEDVQIAAGIALNEALGRDELCFESASPHHAA
jgi:hypothetical protein